MTDDPCNHIEFVKIALPAREKNAAFLGAGWLGVGVIKGSLQKHLKAGDG